MGNFCLHLSNEEKLNVKLKQQIKWPDMLPVSIRLKMDLSHLGLILIGRLQNTGNTSLRKAGC